MADHEMIPTDVEGFSKECKFCGALDTELKFSRSNRCPARSQRREPAKPKVSQEPQHIEVREMTHKQQVLLMQAEWFNGYCYRQLMKQFQ